MPSNPVTDVIQYVVTLVTGQYQDESNLKIRISVESCGKPDIKNSDEA